MPELGSRIDWTAFNQQQHVGKSSVNRVAAIWGWRTTKSGGKEYLAAFATQPPTRM